MAKELIGVEHYEPSCVAAGQNSALFMAENMSQTWPPQLRWAQPPLRSPAESGACLDTLPSSLIRYISFTIINCTTATFVY